MTPSVNRKLAAIMVTDIANFSSMSSRDEKMALNRVKPQHLDEIMHPTLDLNIEKESHLLVKGLQQLLAQSEFISQSGESSG